MSRYTPDGKRVVHRKPRHEVPRVLLGAIDGHAAKVLKLRDDVDDLEDQAARLERKAFEAGFAADTATDKGLRKALNDQADQLRQQAGAVRGKLDRAEKPLAEHMQALVRLHAEARAWQAGERGEGSGSGKTGGKSSSRASGAA